MAAELGGNAEVEGDRLGMADVQVAVGLGRKARDDLGVPAGGDVGGDDLADEVGSFRQLTGVGKPSFEGWMDRIDSQ